MIITCIRRQGGKFQNFIEPPPHTLPQRELLTNTSIQSHLDIRWYIKKFEIEKFELSRYKDWYVLKIREPEFEKKMHLWKVLWIYDKEL